MSKVNFTNLQDMNKTNHRVYIIQVDSEHCVNTVVLDVPYGTNHDEWKNIKEQMEGFYSFLLDKEEHTYTNCGIRLVPTFDITFTEEESVGKVGEHEGYNA